MRYKRFFGIASLLIFLFCPPVSGSGFLVSDNAAAAVTSTNGASVVVKNACGAYTDLLGLDLLDAAKDTLTGTGFKVHGEMEIPIWRFETYIHYYPGDEPSADRARAALGCGKKVEDKTLTPGLIKVILGADAIPNLFPDVRKTQGDPKIYLLDATGDEGAPAKARRLLSDYIDDDLYREFTVNKGMSEETVIYYPAGGLKSAEEIETLLKIGNMKMVSGLFDIFAVLGPDFAGEDWDAVPDWVPDPNVDYEVVVYKTRYIMEIRDPSGTVAAKFPISIGANPDLADKKGVGDYRTPEGDFSVSMIQPSTDWRYDGELAYGPWFIRLKTDPWSGIGIHGTNEPYLIGAPVSHGCIRLHNDNIKKLKVALKEGTKVKIVH